MAHTKPNHFDADGHCLCICSDCIREDGCCICRDCCDNKVTGLLIGATDDVDIDAVKALLREALADG